MTDPSAELDQEARKLAGVEGFLDDQLRGVQLRQGAIESYDSGSGLATITLGGDTTQIAGVAHLASYTPNASDTGVWVAMIGTAPLLIGAIGGGGSSSLFVRKTADETVTSSTSLQNDDHLFLSVAANTTYVVSAYLKHEGTAGEIKFDFTVPAGATLEWQATSPSTSHSEPGDVYTRAHTGSVALAGTESSTIATVSKVLGLLIVAGTAGNLQLRWAQNASNATATELLTNSWLKLDKVV